MNISKFNFELPADRIARFPAQKRGKSKLMLVERKSGNISHHIFEDIVDILPDDSFLVVNSSKVIPAKLFGLINETIIELLLIKNISNSTVEVFGLPAKKLRIGTIITFENNIRAEVIKIGDKGKRFLKFNCNYEKILSLGYAPLPPYIKRKYEEAKNKRNFDLERYQTLYSKELGSIAAPTAGLHFSEKILSEIKKKTEIIELILHVGTATFQTITVENIEDHRMGKEFITIKNKNADKICELKKTKKLTAVGTTSVRSLETYAIQNIKQENFSSEIFIYPGFQFKMVDRLITNFHLPKSSLFILVSAFAGLELMQKAYKIAVEKDYKFFSYGDAMLIL
jgi:S-adenosylmethionine:tRNA ribosyltransferase-isomerase